MESRTLEGHPEPKSADDLAVGMPADDPTTCTALAGALDMIERGCHVFPVTERGKTPAPGVYFTRDATDDPQKIAAELAATSLNYGVFAGRSRLLLLDEDVHGAVDDVCAELGEQLPPTLTVATGKGRHFYFRVPQGSALGNAAGLFSGRGVDVRGGNGYVVGPGSVHENGHHYRIISGGPIAPLPEWLARAVSTSPERSTQGSVVKPDQPFTLPNVIACGARHDTLMRYACSLRGTGVGREDAGGLMALAWEKCEQPPGANSSFTLATACNLLDDIFSRYPAGKAALEGDPESVHSGQVKMAYRLSEAYEGRLLHVHGLGWMSWDGARWSENNPGEPDRAVLDVLRQALADSLREKRLRREVEKCESASGIKGILAIGGSLDEFSTSVTDLDADPDLLNVANGVLNLRTLALLPHNPKDRITKVTRAAWHLTTRPGEWASFLAEVLPDPTVREFVQRLAGVALLGRVVEHILPIFTGPGANGKSVAYQAINYALGDYASTVEPDLFLHRVGAHPTGEMDLRGVRWCVVSETERDRRLAEATMKRLTGGDTIRARRMRQDFVEFIPSHTSVMITNFLPRVSGDDPAIWRRLRVVPFDVVIPPERRDPHLGERLHLAADEVLAWAVEGWVDYVKRGNRLDEPASVMAATEEYRKVSDAVARFVAAECVLHPDAASTTSELHVSWSEWARKDGAEAMGLRTFGEALDRLGYTTTRTKSARLRRGICLVPPRDFELGDIGDA